VVAGGAEVGVADGEVVGGGVEIAKEAGVWAKFFGAALELAGMGEVDSHAAVHGPEGATELDVHTGEAAEVADFFAIGGEAEEDEAAAGVGDGGRADVEEAGAVCELDDLVDVGCDADVLIDGSGVDRGWLSGGVGRVITGAGWVCDQCCYGMAGWARSRFAGCGLGGVGCKEGEDASGEPEEWRRKEGAPEERGFVPTRVHCCLHAA
jgi:hypothetical protein